MENVGCAIYRRLGIHNFVLVALKNSRQKGGSCGADRPREWPLLGGQGFAIGLTPKDGRPVYGQHRSWKMYGFAIYRKLGPYPVALERLAKSPRASAMTAAFSGANFAVTIG
jgi:hypothetical protein